MAMLVVSSGSTAIQPALCRIEGSFPSTKISARSFGLQRTKFQKNRWRIACARADHSSEWRRECSELRVEIQALREALADAWMHDDMKLLELEKLVSALVHMCPPAQVGNVEQASAEARDRELLVTNFAIGRNEDESSEISKLDLEGRDRELSVTNFSLGRNENEASEIAKLELEGADEHYKNAIIISELRSEELRAKQEGLSTLRRLKHLNVHDYVHSALQASHLRSWLKSRGIAE